MRAVELGKAVLAVHGRAGRLQGAVAVHPHKLDAVVGQGCNGGVRAASHLEKVRVLGPAQRVKGRPVVGPSRGHHGAVVVHADQLDVVPVLGRHHDKRAVAAVGRPDGGCKYGVYKAAKAGLRRHQGRADGGKPAVLVHLHELDAVFRVRCHEGQRAAVGSAEGGDSAGAAQHQGAVVGQIPPLRRLQGAVLLYSDQLHAAVDHRGHDGVRVAAGRPERVDGPGPVQLPVAVVVQHACRLQGAVLQYSDRLHAVVVDGCDDGVRFILAHVDDVDRDGPFQL